MREMTPISLVKEELQWLLLSFSFNIAQCTVKNLVGLLNKVRKLSYLRRKLSHKDAFSSFQIVTEAEHWRRMTDFQDGDEELPAKKPRLGDQDCHAPDPSVEISILQECETENNSAVGVSLEPRSCSDHKGEVLVEADVGITEFISAHEGFTGTIKQRYSDFLVNEINSRGEVVHLTEISSTMSPSTTGSDALPPPSEQDCKEESSLMSSGISNAEVEQLRDLASNKDSATEVLILVDGLPKEVRGKIHKEIRKHFPDLDSSTEERDGRKYVIVKYTVQRDGRRTDSWSKKTGDYTMFVLYKENKDTLEAINLISKLLRVKTNSFTYAGTKDRRAKTCQEITAYRVAANRLCDLNKRLRNIALGNFRSLTADCSRHPHQRNALQFGARQCKEPLKLGDHKGNRFGIVLRNVAGSDRQIEDAMTSLRDRGFINYYGMQRFGTTSVPTHQVGRALLRGDWADAINLILKPREGDRDELAAARLVWSQTKDPQRALTALKSFHCMERKLLEGLKKFSKNDLVSALAVVPRNMRLMYIHAYQSYIWNHIISRRIKEKGLQPCLGDLVFEDATLNSEDTDLIQGQGARGEHPKPVVLTQDNISQFSTSDIVFPLPGYDVIYPNNGSADWYKELLTKDNMEDFSFRHSVRDYSLSGSYRKMIARPEDLCWQIISYSNYQLTLVDSDYDLLVRNGTIGRNDVSSTLLGDVNETVSITTADCTAGDDKKFRALKIELSLPSSAYATMAIREILKCGTSAAFQTTLNVT